MSSGKLQRDSAVRHVLGTAVVLLGIIASFGMEAQTPGGKTAAANPDSLVISGYEKQVAEYMKLHKKEEAGLPALKATGSPHQINEHQRLLAAKIHDARLQAKQGAVFDPDVSRLFKQLIGQAYRAANPSKVTASLRHDEPVSDVHLQVNAAYPENVPLQTTPPSILLNLPPLPSELEYRIVGQTLVLRDRGANLIVDYIPGAIPRT